jgi:hypothetical protein
MMQHVVRAFARDPAGFEFADVTFYHPEVRGTLEWAAEYVVEVCAMASREVVDSNNGLAEVEQILKKIGADEPGDSRDDPDFGR